MSASLGVGVRVGLRVAPAVAAAMAVLARPAADLVDDLRAAAAENPALVVEEHPVCPWCGRRATGRACCPAPPRARRAEPPPDADRMAAPVPGWEQLRADAVLAAASLAPAVHRVLDAVDERGLLPPDARDELLDHGLSPAVLAAAVAAIRSVGPAGIAAADPREGLLLQLDGSALSPDERRLARRVLTDGAELIAARGPAAVAAELGVDAAQVVAVLARMRRLLRPFPVPVDGSAAPAPLPPDLVFHDDGGTVRVRLTERERLGVRLDPRDTGGAARELLDHLDRRWAVLDRLAALVAEHHAEALLARSLAFGPLTQATAADRLGVHPSTVSRAVRHRTARLLDGRVVPLRRLFGTHHDVAAAVAELTAAVPRPPDRVVAEVLARRGFRVARRTVTKHRLARTLRA